MKKNIFLALLIAGTATMTSCGLDDAMDLLKHPVYVQGEVDPQFGVPLAKGEVTIDEMLGMFSSSYDGMLNMDSNTITIMFDAGVKDSIIARSLIGGGEETAPAARPHKRGGVATKDVLLSQDTVISYGVDITIFDEVGDIDLSDSNIQINHIWLTFDASVVGDCPSTLRPKISQYVSAQFDSLVITYIDHDGIQHTFDGTPTLNLDFENVLAEQNLHIPNIDVAPIINSMPRHIDASFRFRFNVDESVFGDLSDVAHFNELLDSIGLTKLVYTADVHVEMPFDISIKKLPYDFELDLGEEGLSSLNLQSTLDSIAEGLDVNLDEAKLTLNFDNGIPFDMRLMAIFIDEYGLPMGVEFFKDTILAADVALASDGSGAYVSAAPKHSKVQIALDAERLEQLSKARKINFHLELASSARNANGDLVPVRIQRDDKLRIKMYAVVHPSVTANIPVTHSPIIK